MIDEILNSPLFLVAIPAVVSYTVAKVQAKSNEKNIDKQISAEIERLKTQYHYEQKKDNVNFNNKILLDNFFEIRKELSKFVRGNLELSKIIIAIIDENIEDESKAKKIVVESFKHGDKYPFFGSELEGLMIYMPDLEDEWRSLSKMAMDLIIFEVKNLIDHLNGENDKYKIEDYKNLHEKFQLESVYFSDKVREKARSMIASLY